MFFSVQMHPTIGFFSLQQACQSLLDNIKNSQPEVVFLSSSLTGFLYFKFRFVFWWRCLGIFAMCILLLRTTWIILFAKSTVLIICGITVKLCANGHNNSQQCWDLQCIVGRIHLIRLSNIVALRFGNHGTNEMLGVVGSKLWPVSNFVQQLPTTCNRVCKPM